MKKDRLLKLRGTLAVAVLLAGAVGNRLNAQGGPRGQGPMYDPATEVTVKGTVEEVKLISTGRNSGGTHLIVSTEQGKLEVHVGPTWFLEKNKMSFTKGDSVEVTGSKIKLAGADALIAREVKKGDATLTLRNAQGIPAWAGGGPKS